MFQPVMDKIQLKYYNIFDWFSLFSLSYPSNRRSFFQLAFPFWLASKWKLQPPTKIAFAGSLCLCRDLSQCSPVVSPKMQRWEGLSLLTFLAGPFNAVSSPLGEFSEPKKWKAKKKLKTENLERPQKTCTQNWGEGSGVPLWFGWAINLPSLSCSSCTKEPRIQRGSMWGKSGEKIGKTAPVAVAIFRLHFAFWPKFELTTGCLQLWLQIKRFRGLAAAGKTLNPPRHCYLHWKVKVSQYCSLFYD